METQPNGFKKGDLLVVGRSFGFWIDCTGVVEEAGAGWVRVTLTKDASGHPRNIKITLPPSFLQRSASSSQK
jgi:hypothetical protein